MAVAVPDIDPRDEDALVAAAIAALPEEISDRSPSQPIVKIIEGAGALYAAGARVLNSWASALQYKILNLLDVNPAAASAATVTLRFTRTSSSGTLTVTAGKVVKTGTGTTALTFETDEDLVFGSGELTGDVTATCRTTGPSGNVAAGTLIVLGAAIAGIASVTNPAAASGGSDEETLEELRARSPLSIRAVQRAITAEDFESLTLDSGQGVLRAKAQSDAAGQVIVNILTSDLNETPNEEVTDAVAAYLTERTLPGVIVSAVQRVTKLFLVSNLTVELVSGYSAATVEAAAKAALIAYFDAETWTYGRGVVENDLVGILAGVAGIRRVVSMTYQTSVDFGDTWTTSATLGTSTVAAPNSSWGLFAWGEEYGDNDGWDFDAV